jgi:hypothetical protein
MWRLPRSQAAAAAAEVAATTAAATSTVVAASNASSSKEMVHIIQQTIQSDANTARLFDINIM